MTIMAVDDMMTTLMGSIAILVIGALLILIIAVFVQAALLKFGLEAGEGEEDTTFGARLGTTLFVMLVSSLIPPIGFLFAIKILGSRHDMDFGKSTLSFLIWNFLSGIIITFVTAIVGGIVTLIAYLPLLMV